MHMYIVIFLMFCLILQERDVAGSVPSIPLHCAQQGFPIVQQLSSCSTNTSKEQKTSLFAQHLGSAPLEVFNIIQTVPHDSSQTHNTTGHTHNTAGHTHSIAGHTHSTAGHTHSTTGHTHNTAGHTHSTAGHSHSTAGHTHSTVLPESMFPQSTLVTGDGLHSVGLSDTELSAEVCKIHKENVAKLNLMSQEELESEKERLVQMLGKQ